VHFDNDDDKTRFYNYVRNKSFIGPLSKTIMFAEACPKGGDDDDDDDDDGRSVSTIITLMKYKLMKELLLIKIFYKKLEYTKPITGTAAPITTITTITTIITGTTTITTITTIITGTTTVTTITTIITGTTPTTTITTTITSL